MVERLPEGPQWLYEVKFDGYRAIAVKNGDQVEIRSRNDKNLTAAYPTVGAAVKRLRSHDVVLDGEIVAVDHEGRPSFQALQHRSARTNHKIAYYVFDVLHEGGMPLTDLPLEERRAILTRILKDSELLMSLELPGTAADIIKAVSALRLEGVIAKRRDSKYQGGERSGGQVFQR